MYMVFNTKLLQKFFVNYSSDMFRPQLLVIFRELTSYSTCAAYAPTFVTEFQQTSGDR